jgi:hypothetical protein
MIATQYKITLPSDYDMDIIRERVKKNGYKTDGFEDLKFKLYLITEKGVHHNLQNSYCPLYLWKGSNGLNKFLFNGYFDNILNSFGWQKVNIGIPFIDTTTAKIKDSQYVFQLKGEIPQQESLNQLTEGIRDSLPTLVGTEFIVIYNPDKWKYEVFYFINDINKVDGILGVIYQILYVSQE